ncbi:MAG: hypothetical protein IJW03_04785, partial [Clostridia bacterium]|nr:hypothetical protein [Clostridia bacterium]
TRLPEFVSLRLTNIALALVVFLRTGCVPLGVGSRPRHRSRKKQPSKIGLLVVRMTGLDSRRTTPAVIRGSDSHLGCHSLPLLLQIPPPL